MAAIIISSESEMSSSEDSEFEREIEEAKRRSILERSLNANVGEGSADDVADEKMKVMADGFIKKENESSISILSDDFSDKEHGFTTTRDNEDEYDETFISSDSDSDCSLLTMSKGDRKYLNNDKCVPIYDVRKSGCTYSEAVRVLLDGNDSLTCTKQPILVEDNYMFLVDLTSLEDPDDIKCDDCGHWVHNGCKSTHVAVKCRNGKVMDVKSIGKSTPLDENSRMYCLFRTYYSHDPHEDFKRIFYHIFDAEKVRHHLCLVQYYFDGKPHEIHSKPHGNSKTERPYSRTMKSVHNTLKESTGNATPKQALMDSLQKCGGLLGARSVGSLPKSRSQVRYHQLKNKQKSSTSDQLFSVMLQCKSTDPNSDTAFVRSVAAAPEPMAVHATNRQLNDMVRFLTNPNQHTIMGIDPTFNFGDFNVTPIAFRYLLLEHRKQGHSPIMLGPLLVHQQKKFSSYHFFASTLISLCPSLRNIKSFGTDGESQLYQAFQMQLPEAVHLRCFRHFRANLVTKLTALSMPSEIVDQYMKDIFGTTIDGLHEVGLVDCSTEKELDHRLQGLEETWNCRERSVTPHRVLTFYNRFVKEKVRDIKSSMLMSLREAAGLGSPPSPFYTNANETLNSMLHEKVKYKKSQWHEFNESMKELVKESYRLVELAVVDMGDFKFKPQYQDLVVTQRRWFQMTPQQRDHHLSKVSSASLKDNECTNVAISLPSLCTTPDKVSLSISLSDVNIPSLPREVLEGMWSKAEHLLSTPGQVIKAPCSSSSTKCYVVASKSSDRPHIIQQNKSGQFSCELSCLMWQSSKICAQCIAAADYSHQLEVFLRWYRNSKSKPNLGKLSKVDMPKGSGRKGEKPPRKRKKGSTTCFALVDNQTTSSCPEQNVSDVSVSSVSSSNNDSPTTFDAPPLPHPLMYMPMQNQYNQQSCFNSPTMQNNISLSSFSPYSQVGYQAWHTPPYVPQIYQPQSSMLQQSSPSMQGQSHPFFVRFISGNIRICQGCRGSLRLPDGSIPHPPNDIVVARLEKRPYFDKTGGTWCYPQKETNSHYHLKLSCVVKAKPLFVPSTLQLSPELIKCLTPVHLELLATEFGITANSQ